MKNDTKYKKAIEIGKEMLRSYIFKCFSRKKPEYFSKESKMSFKEIMLFILNMPKKTLQVELNNFFDTVLKRNKSITKQAYSEARQKIKPEAFIALNDGLLNRVIYEDINEYKVWNGYRLSAIDASVLELPNTEQLREDFGYVENLHTKTAKAMASCIYDIQNKFVIKSKIDRYGSSEREMAKALILEMKKEGEKQDLILFDRGYPSGEFVNFLIENKIDFVIRCQRNTFKAVSEAKKEDQIVKLIYKDKAYAVRVLRFMLSSAEEEVLITSLLNEELSVNDFKKLYFYRWGIEVKYNELKNRLEIENFTGATKTAIEQDFYASIYLSNMAELARQESDEIVENNRNDKENKHEYKTNMNVLIGTLKDKFVLMMLEKSTKKRNKMYESIMEQVSKSVVPIRPERHNERSKSKSLQKYRTNRKRSL